MMGMSFHFGFKETILFRGWKTTDEYGIYGSMIGIILMGMIHEAIKNYREHLYVSNAIRNPKGTSPRKDLIFSSIHILQTCLHAFQLILSYFLMFIFMTYNVYLCVAVIIGMTAGYFIFAWKNSRCDIDECCS